MSADRSPKKVINLEEEHYLLQYRDPVTGQWTTEGPDILGHTTAFDVLARAKADPGVDKKWRVVQRPIGEAYASGWKDAIKHLAVPKEAR